MLSTEPYACIIGQCPVFAIFKGELKIIKEVYIVFFLINFAFDDYEWYLSNFEQRG